MLAASAALAATAGEAEDSASPSLDSRSPLTAFEQIWQLTREQIYPPQLVATHFDAASYTALRDRVAALDRVSELPAALNPFLDSLGVSHTQLYSYEEYEYAFFRSLFATRDPQTPPFSHPGLQLLRHKRQWCVREVLDGLPADQAGLRRGDKLLTLDGGPFEPRRLCDGGTRQTDKPHTLGIRRDGQSLIISLACLRQNPHASMHDAISNSRRRIAVGDASVGYLRLWTGTGPEALERYRDALAELADSDALILDLRGGFGGAWYEHLDPFFPDRQGFFSFTSINREGSQTFEAEARESKNPYEGPMVVLINEGTRSGKEAVAYQFKKSGRAVLLGTRTRGAFSAGKGLFVDDAGPLVYYLAVAEYRLDGQVIEGVGIAPDIEVPYPVVASDDAVMDSSRAGAVSKLGSTDTRRDLGSNPINDPQLDAALEHLAKLLGG
ncbi:MAG: S41 family peptidase [Halieaceae bacterium]|jgi:carboxyl-terminal processing protease|nr:S41 family peptidase [Halieaceae bacterium]